MNQTAKVFVYSAVSQAVCLGLCSVLFSPMVSAAPFVFDGEEYENKITLAENDYYIAYKSDQSLGILYSHERKDDNSVITVRTPFSYNNGLIEIDNAEIGVGGGYTDYGQDLSYVTYISGIKVIDFPSNNAKLGIHGKSTGPNGENLLIGLEIDMGDGDDFLKLSGNMTIVEGEDYYDCIYVNGVVATGEGQDTLIVTDNVKVQHLQAGAGDDHVQWLKNSCVRKVSLEEGNDRLTVSSGKFDMTDVVEGGEGNDVVFIKDLGSAGSPLEIGDNLKDIEGIHLKNSHVTTSHLLKLGNGEQLMNNTDGTQVTEKLGLVIENGSSFIPKLSTFLEGELNNAGELNLTQSTTQSTTENLPEDTFRLKGNYIGNSGVIKLNSKWDKPDTFSSDKLIIEGTATGTTTIKSILSDGTEGLQGNVEAISTALNSSAVIEVLTPGQDSAFIGTLQTASGVQAQVAKKTEGGKDIYYYTIEAKNAANTADASSTLILDESVSAYTQIGAISNLLAQSPVQSLHQRKGEQVKLSTANNQAWIRVLGGNEKYKGKNRFDFTTRNSGIQVGYDISKQAKNGNFSITGGYLAYQKAHSDLYDRYRSVNAIVSSDTWAAKVKSEITSIGLTHTYHTQNGRYIDLLGQYSYLKHDYHIRNLTNTYSNSGKNILFSIEAGNPFALGNGWLLEPQVQLVYQWQKLQAFNAENSEVKFKGKQEVLGRIGGRLAYQTERSGFYTIANLWHQFHPTSEVSMSGTNWQENYAKNMLELGIGGQYDVTKQVSLYTDVRYKRTLGQHSKGALQGSLGIKFNW